MLADFLASCRTAESGDFWSLATMAAVCAAGSGVLALRRFRGLHGLEALPPRSTEYSITGYVELQGRASALPGPEIVSPLSGTRCLWWSYTVDEIDGDDGARRIHEGTSDDLFLLQDGQGEYLVDPEGAEIEPSLSRKWAGGSPRPDTVPTGAGFGLGIGRYRYSEKLLLAGTALYAAGWLRTNAVTEGDLRRDVSALLAEWKRDPVELLRRFDADGNGEIDLVEWEAARAAALAEIRRQHESEGFRRDLLVLCSPPEAGFGRRPFVLSTRPRERVLRRRRYIAHAWLATGATLGAVILLAVHARLG